MSDEPRFEFGDRCPKLKAWFFPSDPNEKPREIEDKDEQEDSPQPS